MHIEQFKLCVVGWLVMVNARMVGARTQAEHCLSAKSCTAYIGAKCLVACCRQDGC